MAEKIFTNVRLGLKVDSLENWKSSSLVLKRGEVAFATVAAAEGTGLTEPVVMMKIGDGEKTFSQLGFDFYAKASDVVAAAKSEASLTTFVNNVIANAGIATSTAMEALSGRVTTAEGEIDTLQSEMDAVEAKAAANETAIGVLNGLVGDKKVSDAIAEAIAALKLGETYAAKSLETTVADHVADTVAHVTTADKTKWNGALQASDIASGAANGTIAVKGTDVAVTGLGSAAFTESTAYDVSGAAATAEANAKSYAKEYADGLAGNYDAAGAAATAESNAKAYAKEYADGLADNYDAAGSAAQALTDAKAYTDGEFDRLVGDKTVGTQISEAITALDLANTYDAKGAAAQALVDAKAYADAEDAKIESRVDALEADTHTHANKAELDKIADGDVAKWNAAEQNAKDYADGLNTAMDSRVDALEAKFTGDDSVADQIADAVAAEAALREEEDGKLQDAIDAIEADYLKAADKTALQEQITANDGEIAALQGLVGDTAVATQITNVTNGLDERIKAIEDDYLTSDDKTELQGNIDTVSAAVERLTNGVSADEIDGVNDLIAYVNEHGTEVTGMKADIKANADDIAAMDTAYKAADTALSGRIDTLEAIDHDAYVAADTALKTELNTEIAKKAAQTDLEALAGRVTTAEGEIDTLQSDLDTAEAAIEALETKVGEKPVAEQITAVTNPLTERVVALEAVDHEHANAEELAKFVDGDKAKLDAAVQTVTAGTGLTAVKTGTDVAINIDETVTWIFDCGTSAV